MTFPVSMPAADLTMAACGLVAVGAAVAVVATRQLVHAALWLVVSLGGVAGCFLAMGAEFLAWLQLLIYVGAVVVIVLFGFMLTRAPIGRSDDLTSSNRLVALIVAVAATLGLLTVLGNAFWHVYVDVAMRSPVGGEAIGRAVFSVWILPFEALSVLLLAALIGAIALSRSGSDGG